jgi:phosphoglycolate phosphatase-like HAD superfamily hydrolase
MTSALVPGRPDLTHVIFDFDGTLSWLRHGWPRLMAGIFRPYYPALPGETEEQILDLHLSDILSRNGRPTIFQMMRFCERVHARHGRCPAPEELRQEYQDRLDAVIAERSALLRRGQAQPDDFVVHGARVLLDKLKARGLRLMVLSGTLEERVREEARLLHVADYFGPHIYGSGLDSTQFSKRDVIARLLREENVPGRQILSFGDGPVEIQETKAVGGMAMGVASDEERNGSGEVDPWKARQLTEAGADAVIPDFRDPDNLLAAIFGPQHILLHA